jgi:hypothetical protein
MAGHRARFPDTKPPPPPLTRCPVAAPRAPPGGVCRRQDLAVPECGDQVHVHRNPRSAAPSLASKQTEAITASSVSLTASKRPSRGGPTPPSPPGRLPPTVSLHRGGRGAQPQVWTAPPTQRRGRTPPRWPLCRRREGLKHAAKNVHVLLRHRPPSIPRSQRRPGVAPDVARFGHRLRLALWRSSSASASCRLAASR